MGGMAGGLGGMASSVMANSPIMSAISGLSGLGATPTAGAATANPFDAAVASAQPVDSLPQLSALPQLPGLDASAPATTPAVETPQTTANSGYTDMIRRSAQRWGVDPDTALRVAKAEGGTDKWIQSNVVGKNGRREPSYGPFQMLIGGGDTGFPEGMGNQIIRERGIDPRDPRNAEQVIDFAMEQASQKGWGQWYGAKAVGIGNMDGIGGRPSGVSPMSKQVMGEPTAAGGNPIHGDYSTSLKNRMFGGEMQPGQGEQMQKSRAQRVIDAVGQGGGRGMSAQQSQAQETGGGAQAYDDSGEFLASNNERIAAMRQGRGAQRTAERKQALTQRVRGR